MAIWIEFARNGQPGVGDRALIRVDARVRFDTMRHHAADHGRRHGFTEYRVLRGDHLLAARPMGEWRTVGN